MSHRQQSPICPLFPRRVNAVTTPSPPPFPPVDVVLPRPNEAATLLWVLDHVPAGRRALGVDDGSTDGPADVTRALGATAVRAPRRGFGAGCHAGLTAATAGIVCCRDRDASPDPSHLVRFVAEVRAGESGLVLGRRRPHGRAADAGPRVAEHDVPCPRRTGASEVNGTWRGTRQAVRVMRRVLPEQRSAPEAGPR